MSDPVLTYSRATRRRSPLGDDWSYMLPMAAFLGFTQVGVTWPGLFPIVYATKTVITAFLLYLCWPAFTKIDWRWWKLGIVMGIVGVVQWIAMEKLLLHFWPSYPRAHLDVLNPYETIPNPGLRLLFLVFRWLGPTLVVPFMEELFWRDWLWRVTLAPNDFKLAKVGEWDAKAFLVVSALFASVHPQMWITALVWGMLIGLLLVRTKSLGACIVMHGVTNFLLGAWVLWRHDWMFW
jgi:CAAX prenyl protease-like protein